MVRFFAYLSTNRTNNESIRTIRIDKYKNQSENKIWLIFLLPKNENKNIQMKGCCKKTNLTYNVILKWREDLKARQGYSFGSLFGRFYLLYYFRKK